MPPVFLGDAASGAIPMLLVLGLAILLPLIIDPSRTSHRVPLFLVAGILALRYAWWRLTETIAPIGWTWDFAASWSLAAFEMAALLGSLSGFVLMSRVRQRTAEVERHRGWWGDAPLPRVAILIATYNESLEVLERTIVGALALNHPAKEVVVLDDGRRDWLHDYCNRQGVRYLRRADNKGSKAGNINAALQVLRSDPTPPEFIAVLDADFVPHRGFISRSLALFHDPTVGLVQTPQHFFNADPIQHNLGLSRSYPDEQRFFFDHMQPSRDAWGIAICCGTSSMVRLAALDAVGDFPTDSVTEDFLLTVVLQTAGYQTVYLNEPLTEGLAPEGLKEYVTQRARWCLGQMQIVRSRFGPLGMSTLRLRDRWSMLDATLYWVASFPFRIAALVYPLLYWFFNITVVDAEVADVLSYFGTYFVWVTMVMNTLSRGLIVPVIHDVSQLLGAIPITRAAFVGLLRPRGHPFSVTAKGGDRSQVTVQWSLMFPYLCLLVLTLVGLSLGIMFDSFAFYDAGDGKSVILFWTIYNAIVLAVLVIACVELPRNERHIADKPERAIFVAEGKPGRVWLVGMTQNSARIRGQVHPAGTRGLMRIREVGDVPAIVLEPTIDGGRVALLPNEEQQHNFMRRFYTEGEAPGVIAVKSTALLNDLARRFSFSWGRP
ncbi:glycosyltransferase [Tabrizicola piscis]|uniref:Glycosyltransferase n=2 Tax=Tabrizicola piscis TaxID=2494374 RepID=A0A3S8UCI1_9RHOB|nr:glycosyltransferase [Tabrizicola piscis]